MRKLFSLFVLIFISVLQISCAVSKVEELTWYGSGKKGVVVAGRTGSTEAGLAILKQGGNAADAAVATLLALNVTDGDQFAFGSEAAILIYEANRGVVEVISGMGAAPKLATREYFEEVGGIKKNTIQSAAVPAALDAYITILDRYGTMRFSQVAAPALELLDQHNEDWHAELAHTFRRLIKAEQKARDRKRGLRLVADYFYRGPIAREIDAWNRANGGLIRYTDLATHTTHIEEPIKVNYRGYSVYKCDTWTQGPYLLQTLRLLEGFDLKSMGYQTAQSLHLLIEAMKLALADRDIYYGDRLFVDVPMVALFSDEYTQMRGKLIDLQHASFEHRPGDPVGSNALLDEKRTQEGLKSVSNDTTTCLTADRWGNVVAVTPSGWSGVKLGKTGVWTGSRLISFNLWKGHPNCIEPGKRPRITLTPTLILKDGKPVLAISVAGGDTQDQGTLQIVTNYIDFGKKVKELVVTPKYATGHLVGSFNQPPPSLGKVDISKAMGKKVLNDLRKLGHELNEIDSFWQLRTVIEIDPKTGKMTGAGDPKAEIVRHTGAF